MLQQRLADALGNAAMDLALHDDRVDHPTAIRWLKVLRVDEEDNILEVLDFTQLSKWSVVDFRAGPVSGDVHFLHLNEGMVYRISYSGTVSVSLPPDLPASLAGLENLQEQYETMPHDYDIFRDWLLNQYRRRDPRK